MSKTNDNENDALKNQEAVLKSKEAIETDIWGDEAIENQKEVLVKKTASEKQKIKEQKKLAKASKEKKAKGLKKFFFGIGKEFERISWTTKKDLITGFLITIVIVIFFAIIFTLISIGITSI